MKLVLKLLLILIPPLLYSQERADYYTESFNVVYGSKNFTGEKDCKAKCSLTSDGKNLIIKVEVTDDRLIFNNSIYSDHIELWFGYQYSREGNQSAYITGSDRYLYHYQNKPYLKSVIEEIKNPFIHDIAGMSTSKNYNLLTEDETDRWLKSEIDTYLGLARRDSLIKNYVFFGVTHFGINPDNGLVTFYDRENYNYFKKYLDTEIGELNNFINTQTTVSKNKYTADITVNPEALGFVHSSGFYRLNFLIDIVDSDKEGEQSSLLSTSKNRKWGDIDTFNDVRLKKLIEVNINPDFPFLGRDGNSSNIEYELLQKSYDTYIYTDQGWKGIQRIADDFENYEYLIGTFTLPNIQRYYFEINDLAASTMKVGDRDVPTYTFDRKSYITLGEKLLDNDNVIELFQLPNSELAAIIYEERWIHRGTWNVSELWLAKETGDNILIGKASAYKFILNDTIEVDSYFLKSYANYPWMNIRLSNLSSNSLILEFENDTVEIQWNDDGNSLEYKLSGKNEK